MPVDVWNNVKQYKSAIFKFLSVLDLTYFKKISFKIDIKIICDIISATPELRILNLSSDCYHISFFVFPGVYYFDCFVCFFVAFFWFF